jgi:hypothetical protein
MTDDRRRSITSSQETEIIAAFNWPIQSAGAEILREAAKRERVNLNLMALSYTFGNRS